MTASITKKENKQDSSINKHELAANKPISTTSVYISKNRAGLFYAPGGSLLEIETLKQPWPPIKSS